MSNRFRIHVDDQRLKEAQRLFRALPRDLQNRLRRQERAEALPIWKEEIAARKEATTLASRVYASGIGVNTGAYISLIAKGSTRKIRGTDKPWNTLLGAAEFGSTTKDNYTRYYAHSRHGRQYVVERRTRAELPDPRRKGWVAFPAAVQAVERIKSLQIQTTIRQIHEAARGGA